MQHPPNYMVDYNMVCEWKILHDLPISLVTVTDLLWPSVQGLVLLLHLYCLLAVALVYRNQFLQLNTVFLIHAIVFPDAWLQLLSSEHEMCMLHPRDFVQKVQQPYPATTKVSIM